MSCQTHLAGIQKLYISEVTGTSFTYFVPTGYSNQIIIPTSRVYTQIEIDADANFQNKKVVDKYGTTYEKEIKFLFEGFESDFDYSNVSLLFKTNNERWYVAGYDVPFSVAKEEAETGGEDGESVFQITFESKSYNKVKEILQTWSETATGITFSSGPTGSTQTYPIYWGKYSSAGAIAGGNRPSGSTTLIDTGNEVVVTSTETVSITFNSSNDEYCWVAIPAASTTKTVWFVDDDNQGFIGGAVGMGGNLFPTPVIVDYSNYLFSNVLYRVYITNWQGEIISIQLRNS